MHAESCCDTLLALTFFLCYISVGPLLYSMCFASNAFSRLSFAASVSLANRHCLKDGSEK